MTSRRRVRPVPAACVVVTTLLAACDAGETDDPVAAVAVTTSSAPPPTTAAASSTTVAPPTSGAASTTVAPATPAGFRRVAGDGFALALPDTWQAYRLDGEGGVTALDGAPALPPGLAELAVAAGLQGTTLLAVGPASGDGRSESVLVSRLGADAAPTGVEISTALRDRLAADGISDLRVETTEVAGQPAARATFRQTGGEDGTLEQEAVTIYVTSDEASYLLAFSRPLPAEGESSVDAVIDTFIPT